MCLAILCLFFVRSHPGKPNQRKASSCGDRSQEKDSSKLSYIVNVVFCKALFGLFQQLRRRGPGNSFPDSFRLWARRATIAARTLAQRSIAILKVRISIAVECILIRRILFHFLPFSICSLFFVFFCSLHFPFSENKGDTIREAPLAKPRH